MTKVTALFFFISMICVIGFGMLRDRLIPQQPTQPIPTRRLTAVTPLPQPTVAPQSVESTLKIAIPDGQRVELIDGQGRISGSTLTGLRNDIPHSECKPDAMLGTVTWILLTPPQETLYTLKVIGSSDKAIAVYLKNTSGFEGLELIESKDHDALKEYTYSLTVKHDTAQHIISIEEH